MKIHHIGYAVKKIEDSINEFKKLGYRTTGNKITDNLRKVIIQFIENEIKHLECRSLLRLHLVEW